MFLHDAEAVELGMLGVLQHPQYFLKQVRHWHLASPIILHQIRVPCTKSHQHPQYFTPSATPEVSLGCFLKVRLNVLQVICTHCLFLCKRYEKIRKLELYRLDFFISFLNSHLSNLLVHSRNLTQSNKIFFVHNVDPL